MKIVVQGRMVLGRRTPLLFYHWYLSLHIDVWLRFPTLVATLLKLWAPRLLQKQEIRSNQWFRGFCHGFGYQDFQPLDMDSWRVNMQVSVAQTNPSDVKVGSASKPTLCLMLRENLVKYNSTSKMTNLTQTKVRQKYVANKQRW